MDIFLEPSKILAPSPPGAEVKEKKYNHFVDLILVSDSEHELQELTKLFNSLDNVPKARRISVVKALNKSLSKT